MGRRSPLQRIGLWLPLAATLAAHPACAEPIHWIYEAVDPPKAAGDHAAALDAQDHAHVLYGRDALYYDWEEADGWHSEVADATSAPQNIVMTLEESCLPHVVYQDLLTQNLKYARRAAEGWSIETLAQEAYAAALCLDSAGRPHVVYLAPNAQVYHGVMLKHLSKDASGWHASTVGYWNETAVRHPVIRIADDGQPHLCCSLERYEGTPRFALFHARWTSGSWEPAEVAIYGSGPGQFDAAGRLHLTYYDDDDVGWEGVAYVMGTGATFVTEPLLQAGYGGYPCVRLAVSRTGVPHVMIGDDGSWSGLQHQWRTNGVWHQTVVDTNATQTAVLALDAADRPHVLYRVKVGSDPDTTYFTNRAWLDEQGWHVQEDPSGPLPEGTLLVTGDNRLRLAQSRLDSGTRFYSEDEAGWQERVLAPPRLHAITEIRLALDNNNHPHIAYNGVSGMGFRYAWRDTAGWHTEQLEDAYPNGGASQSDLALDGQGRPHIGYRSPDGGLAYAVLGDEGWQRAAVMVATNVVDELALALDHADRPHFLLTEYERISGAKRLIHVWEDELGWHRETVAPVADGLWRRPMHPNIAVDHVQSTHICYFDSFLSETLKYGRRTAQGWQITTADADGTYAGMHCSLQLDDQNQPHIAYVTWQPSELRYARKDASGWHVSTVDSAGELYDFEAQSTSLCLAPDGTPWITYSRNLYADEITHESSAFCYAHPIGTEWEVIELESGSATCSLAIDSEGWPHIAYSGGRDNLSYLYSVPAPPALDHFTWSAVHSPRAADDPFPVTLTARNPSGITVTSFTDSVTLSGHVGSVTSTNLILGTGTGSWEFPMYTFYHDARTQVIYPAAELAGAATLTSLALEITSPPGQTLQNWTIRLKHTPLAEYSTSPQWEVSGWTIVFQTNEPAGTGGWRTFEFSTPFEYNGADNLLVDFSFDNDSYTSWGQCRSTVSDRVRSLYSYSDSYDGDPLGWSGTRPVPLTTRMVPNLILGMRQDDTAPVTLSPTRTGSFVDGEWTGMVTVHAAATNLFLRADDGAGHLGESGLFSVRNAPRLVNCGLSAGQFAFDLDGQPGDKLLIQASTDLRHWVTLEGCQLADTPLGFVDPESHRYPRRFYRLMAAEGVALMEQHRWQSGQFHLNLVGEPGRTVVVEASADLADWTPIATNLLGTNPIFFADPQSAQFPQRFYRVVTR